MTTSYRDVIVGGGVHGTYLAAALLRQSRSTREELRIIEPMGELLADFERQCRNTGMQALRSPFVHHLGADPFSLESFAETRDREDELVEAYNGADRPTVDLFFDHAQWVIDQLGLDELVCSGRVTAIEPAGNDGVDVVTDRARYRTDNCTLAIGTASAWNRPEWANQLPKEAAVEHVFGDFEPETVGPDESVCVIGGAISAVQVATLLADRGVRVEVRSRRPFRAERIEADPTWMNWRYIDRRLGRHEPGSKARYGRVQAARYDGTVTEYSLKRFRDRVASARLEHAVSSVTAARTIGNTIELTLADETAASYDRVVLATGFGPAAETPLLERIAEACSLARGYRGYPVLDQSTLRWVGHEGRLSPIAVSGLLAELTVGPYARNIVGARRAAERIVEPRPACNSRESSQRVTALGSAD